VHEVDKRYRDGTYLASNPGWHLADSAFKAKEALRAISDQVLEEWRQGGGVRVCDIGCGAGGVLAGVVAGLRQRGLEVGRAVGYDISPQAIALARRHHPELEFRCEDFFSSDETYDLGLLIDVLEHLAEPESFLRSVTPRMQWVLVHLPLEQNLYAIVRGQQDLRRREVGHVHFFHRFSALGLLRQGGYDVVRWHYTVDLRDQGLSWRGRVWRHLMRMGMAIAPDLAVHTLGCASVMALCRRSQLP